MAGSGLGLTRSHGSHQPPHITTNPLKSNISDTPLSPPPPPLPWRSVLQWSGALACLGYIGWFFWDQWDQLDLALNLAPQLLAGLVALYLLMYAVNTYRFRLFVEKSSGRSISFRSFFKLLMLSSFLNTVASQTGNVYRAVTLKRQHGIDYAFYLSALLAMGWLNVSQDLLTGWAVITAWGGALPAEQAHYAPLLLPLALCVLLGPYLSVKLLLRLDPQDQRLRRLKSKLADALQPMVGGLRDWRYLLKIAISGIAQFVVNLALLYQSFLAFGLSPALPGLAVFAIVLRLSVMITITPGNIGLREMAFGLLADQVGIGMAQGLLVSALMRVVGTSVLMLSSAALGGVGLLHHGASPPEAQ